MTLPKIALEMILAALGEDVLAAVLAADSKGLGIARKADAQEMVDQVAECFQLGDDLKLRRPHVIALVKDQGIDKAMRVLLILADGTPDTLKSRRAQKPKSLVEQMTTVKASHDTLVGQILKGR